MKVKYKKPYKKDLTGLKFNRLTVVSFSHSSKNNGSVWNCVCECGGTSAVTVSSLTKGYTKSCGCLHSERTSEVAKRHGMCETPIYQRWKSIKSRCKNLSDPVYGGGGVTYDPRWEVFENFYDDMGEGFLENLEIDRIDVNKGYSKENCRWITHNENNFNKNRQSNNTSGRTGVSFKKELGKYRAYITVDRKQINLGVFDEFEDAVTARESAEIEYYGYHRP